MLLALGVVLIYVAFAQPPALGLQIFLVALGVLSLYATQRMWEATSASLELTRHELRDTAGRVLCRLDEVEKVDRSAFAFKPANGFLVRVKAKAPRAFHPGLWWRIGKSVGVGGVINKGEARAMAELLSLQLDPNAPTHTPVDSDF